MMVEKKISKSHINAFKKDVIRLRIKLDLRVVAVLDKLVIY